MTRLDFPLEDASAGRAIPRGFHIAVLRR